MAIKYSEGFSKLFPSTCVIGLYCASFYAMSLAVKKIELGVAYAIWSGVGIILTSALGVMLFNEEINLKKNRQHHDHYDRCYFAQPDSKQITITS